MAVFNLFSKRRKAERGPSDVYTYDKIPEGLRIQIVHIWTDAIGNPGEYGADRARASYQEIVEIFRREYQVFVLTENNRAPYDSRNAFGELCEFFLTEKTTERVIDIIEVTARVIDGPTRNWNYLGRHNADQIATEAIEELNTRFRENAVGYEFANGNIVRVDNQLAHAEIVKPTLQILQDKHYANAQKEFLQAHENYRHRKYAECLVECNKAFESTMKIICDKRGWPHNPSKSTASELIKTCFDKGLIPPYWDNHFTGLRTTLTSGIPTARNRQGGRGAGTLPNNEPPQQLVSYVLHMTASTILFLAESERKLQ
jgi:hypothetical protein